jgi:hypothetical protein
MHLPQQRVFGMLLLNWKCFVKRVKGGYRESNAGALLIQKNWIIVIKKCGKVHHFGGHKQKRHLIK